MLVIFNKCTTKDLLRTMTAYTRMLPKLLAKFLSCNEYADSKMILKTKKICVCTTSMVYNNGYTQSWTLAPAPPAIGG